MTNDPTCYIPSRLLTLAVRQIEALLDTLEVADLADTPQAPDLIDQIDQVRSLTDWFWEYIKICHDADVAPW